MFDTVITNALSATKTLSSECPNLNLPTDNGVYTLKCQPKSMKHEGHIPRPSRSIKLELPWNQFNDFPLVN